MTDKIHCPRCDGTDISRPLTLSEMLDPEVLVPRPTRCKTCNLILDGFTFYFPGGRVVPQTETPPKKSRAADDGERLSYLSRLLVLWNENPTMRLGQLVANCFPGDIYHIEDENLVGMMEVRYRTPGGLVHRSREAGR